MFDPKNPQIANRSPLLTGRGNAHHFYVVYSCVHNVFLLPFRPYAPCPIKPAGVPVMSPKNGAMQMDTPFLNKITQYIYYKADFCAQMDRWSLLYYTQPSEVLQFRQSFSWAEGFFQAVTMSPEVLSSKRGTDSTPKTPKRGTPSHSPNIRNCGILFTSSCQGCLRDNLRLSTSHSRNPQKHGILIIASLFNRPGGTERHGNRYYETLPSG